MATIIFSPAHGLCILAGWQPKPAKWWLQLQEVPAIANSPWFKAFPLSGGSVLLQAHRFTVQGEATAEQLALAMDRANSFGKEAIAKLAA